MAKATILTSLLLALFGIHSISSAAIKDPLATNSADPKAPAFAFLADRTTGSIHQFDLVHYTDSVLPTGIGTVRGLSLSGQNLFVLDNDLELYQLSFDQSWNLLTSNPLGSLDAAADYIGSAFFAEGNSVYTAGPRGVAHFQLSSDHSVVKFKDRVTTIGSIVSFSSDAAGTLFLLDACENTIYQVGGTAQNRDWNNISVYKRLRVDRSAAVAADPQGNLFVGLSNEPASPPFECGQIVPAYIPPIRDLPQGVSVLVEVAAQSKHEGIFWYGLPLDFDPPTQGVVGLDFASGVLAAVSKTVFSATGSSLLLFSTTNTSLLTYWDFPQDEMISVALTTGDIAVNPDFSISCSPAKDSIVPGQSAQYTVTLNPVGGWSNEVQLSVDGVPTPATVTIDPNTIGSDVSAISTITISNTTSLPSGVYALTITATVLTRNPTGSSHRKTKCMLRIT